MCFHDVCKCSDRLRCVPSPSKSQPFVDKNWACRTCHADYPNAASICRNIGIVTGYGHVEGRVVTGVWVEADCDWRTRYRYVHNAEPPLCLSVAYCTDIRMACYLNCTRSGTRNVT